MSETIEMILVVVFVYAAAGVYVYLMTIDDLRDSTIGQKTAMVIWCGPVIWLGAMIWLLNKWIVDKVDKKFGEQYNED